MRRSGGAVRIAVSKARWRRSGEPNGRSSHAASATQGECSTTGPSSEVNVARSMASTAAMAVGAMRGKRTA